MKGLQKVRRRMIVDSLSKPLTKGSTFFEILKAPHSLTAGHSEDLHDWSTKSVNTANTHR